MKNLNLLFNKIYYEDLNSSSFGESVKRHNENIFYTSFEHSRDYKKSEIAEDEQTFVLKTKYPGLLIGTGTPHGSHKSDYDINVGFSFDYVTGQPYIPGSSVKGVLRSHFRNRPEAIKEILGNSDINIADLEKSIFDGKDIFLDAVVFDGNENGLILGSDYITPHTDATKNPVPISIMKVLPDVRFEFRFVLDNGSGIIGKSAKLKLFCILLQLFGVGAKTNVGYGHLEEADRVITSKKPVKTNFNLKCGSNYQNIKQPQGDTVASGERKRCPNCGFLNYKYYQSGDLRKKCKKCQEFLYPRS